MRFFIGIVPPSPTLEKIADFQKSSSSNRVPFWTEPHITVKAQSGFTDNKKWLEKVEPAVKNFGSIDIALDGLDTFDQGVLFLKVKSEKISALHDILLETIDPSLEDRKKYFELESYNPHLTLGGIDFGMSKKELDTMQVKAEKILLPVLQDFSADFIRIYMQEKPGAPYKKLIDIILK